MQTPNPPPLGGAFEPPSPAAKSRPSRDQIHSASEPLGPNAIIKLNPTPLRPWSELSLVAHCPHSRPRAIDPLEHTRRPFTQPQQMPSNKLTAFSVRHSSTHPRRRSTPPRCLVAEPFTKRPLPRNHLPLANLFHFYLKYDRYRTKRSGRAQEYPQILHSENVGTQATLATLSNRS